jgi:hypothetical protein
MRDWSGAKVLGARAAGGAPMPPPSGTNCCAAAGPGHAKTANVAATPVATTHATTTQVATTTHVATTHAANRLTADRPPRPDIQRYLPRCLFFDRNHGKFKPAMSRDRESQPPPGFVTLVPLC